MVVDAADAMWDAYVHSNELQVQQQYQQDMAVREVFDDVNWDEVGKKTLVSTIEGAAGGATTGFLSGYFGAPFTAGTSLPACAAIGGLIGGTGGLVGGFTAALFEELVY